MSQPPFIPGPGQKPPPLPEFAPPPTTKKFVPWKFKVWLVIIVAFVLLIWMGLASH